MTEMSDAIRQARAKWKYRGQRRPAFAEPVSVGQESVWDYPRPPCVESDAREVVVKWREATIAETARSVRVLETASPPTFYLPPEDVRVGLLQKALGRSICEWKGRACYWSIVVGENRLDSAAWSYEEPFAGFAKIAGYFSFYPAVLECYVNGSRVEPQRGGLYGGWITREVVGPFKGEPGTENW